MTTEADSRPLDAARPVTITPDFIKHAEGSVLIECGETKVVCTASLEDRVPPFLRGKGQGWVTAEYGMLPRSTGTRMTRESSRGRLSGRTQEIQRLIGRSLRAVTHLPALGERTVWIDCDVIQADGGTRTASITGAFVSLALAIDKLVADGVLKNSPLIDFVAAISVGVVDGRPRLDLAYEQDVAAEVDMNVVMTGQGEFVEVQGTAEKKSFPRSRLDELLDLAQAGISDLIQLQRTVLTARLGDLSHLIAPETAHATAPSGDDQ